MVSSSKGHERLWQRLIMALVLALAMANMPMDALAEDVPGPLSSSSQLVEERDSQISEESASKSAGEVPKTDAFWPQFKGAGASGVTTAATPVSDGTLAWSVTPDGALGFSNRSDPIIVGDKLYMAENEVLYQLNLSDGRTSASLSLDARIDSTCRPVYDQADGLILVLLHGGQVEAVRMSADGLQKAWTSQPIAADEQTLTTPLLSDGRLYFGTTDGGSPSKKGHLVCLDAATGKVVWNLSQGTGYYWSGAAMTSRGLLIGDDAGNLTLRDPSDGSEIAHVNLGGPIRSTTVLSDDGTLAYVVTRDDGVLHAVDVASMTQVSSVAVCDYSTSTPTVDGTTLYVGGLKSQRGGIFAVDVSDPASPRVTASITSLGSGAAVGEVKSTPLVSHQAAGTYVYFSANDNKGALYCWKVGDGSFGLLFQPEESQWCMASVICDSDGALYYSNDSSALFKVVTPSSVAKQPQRQTSTDARNSDTSTRTADKPGGDSSDDDHAGSHSSNKNTATDVSDANLSNPDPPDGDDDPQSSSDNEEGSSQKNGSARQPVTADQAQEPARTVPVWPIVGIVAGAIVLVLVIVWPKLSERWRKRHDR